VFVEINKDLLKKTESDLEKRWFRDADRNCDLFLWQNTGKEVMRFQFWVEDTLLEWNAASGFKTGRLDQHSGAFTNYQAPIFRYHQRLDEDILNSIEHLLQGDLDKADDLAVFDTVLEQLEKLNAKPGI